MKRPQGFSTMVPVRIIAGHFRGRRLLGPRGRSTRPITDRVKQSVFDILTPLLPGAVVYDCFAGTGSLGLESLSRGAGLVVFFECERSAVAMLRRNLALLGAAQGIRDLGRSRLVIRDLFRWFRDPANDPQPQEQAHIVFLDPPYRYIAEKARELHELAARIVRAHLRPGGLVVFRHPAARVLALPPLVLVDRRRYGSMAIDFLRTPHDG